MPQLLMIVSMVIMPSLARFAPESRFSTDADLPPICQRATSCDVWLIITAAALQQQYNSTACDDYIILPPVKRVIVLAENTLGWLLIMSNNAGA